MAVNYPTNLDSFTNPTGTSSVANPSHAQQHSDANDAIEALQAKVGVDNSSVATSLDYRVRSLENASLDTEGIQDIIAGVLTAGSHTNITVTYDDANNKINLASTYDDEEVMDAIATALSAGTGVLKSYDDTANTITLSVDTSTIATKQFVTDTITNLLGANNGIASLDAQGFVPNSQLNIDERIQDVASTMITSATHTNVTVSYDDNTGKLSFTGIPLTQEQVQDFIAPLLAHSLHTNITATYDDTNNKIVLEGSGGGGGSGTGGSLTNSWWLGS